jgi:hypothetical protein
MGLISSLIFLVTSNTVILLIIQAYDVEVKIKGKVVPVLN